MKSMRKGIRRKVAIGTIALGALGVIGTVTPAYGFTGLALPGSSTPATTTPPTTASSGGSVGFNFTQIMWKSSPQ
jgi:hypothetical protein